MRLELLDLPELLDPLARPGLLEPKVVSDQVELSVPAVNLAAADRQGRPETQASRVLREHQALRVIPAPRVRLDRLVLLARPAPKETLDRQDRLELKDRQEVQDQQDLQALLE